MSTPEEKVAPQEDATSCSAKYVFMDIVGFSKERHLDAQSAIVSELNKIVRESVSKNGVPDKDANRIFIPTGDGICVAVINNESYDVHMRIALDILGQVDEHNNQTNEDVNKFQVRIGINANEDNLIEDINKRTNLAGAGITLAQRIMDKADGNQILVGQSVCESLGQHKEYWRLFKEHETEDKHGNKFHVYQYEGLGHVGLNTDTPRSLMTDGETPRADVQVTLSKDSAVAYYFALAIKHEQFLKANQNESHTGMVLLWILACDYVGGLRVNQYQEYAPIVKKTNPDSFEGKFNSYNGEHYSLRSLLASYIRDVELSKYEDCFVIGKNTAARLFINDKGKKKLQEECPQIWEDIGL